MAKKCPKCGFHGWMSEVNCSILRCPVCMHEDWTDEWDYIPNCTIVREIQNMYYKEVDLTPLHDFNYNLVTVLMPKKIINEIKEFNFNTTAKHLNNIKEMIRVWSKEQINNFA